MTLLVCLTVGAQAGIIFSSGFDGTPVPGGYTTIYSGPGGTLGPWTVVSGNVDWIRGYWQSALGTSGSVDMSGNGPGVLSTSLATIAGQAYDLSFYLAGNPDGGDGPRTINVEVGNVDESFTFPGGQSEASMGWVQETVAFVANGNDALTFTSLENTAYGPALDQVTVSSAPEPSSCALVLIGLAGGIKLIRRRRKAVA